MGTWGRRKGLSRPSGSGSVLAGPGAAAGEAGGGTDTALSYFPPPPAEEFSQRLGRPQGSGWGEEQAGSAAVPHLLWLSRGHWGHPGALSGSLGGFIPPGCAGRSPPSAALMSFITSFMTNLHFLGVFHPFLSLEPSPPSLQVPFPHLLLHLLLHPPTSITPGGLQGVLTPCPAGFPFLSGLWAHISPGAEGRGG